MSRVIAFVSGIHVLTAFICLLVGGYFLFQTGPYPQLKQRLSHASLPEEKPMSLTAIHAHFETLQATGRSQYASFQYLDFLNILLMLAFFSLFLAWLLQKLGKSESRMRLLVLVPTLLASLDVFENLCLLALVAQYPKASSLGNLFPFLTVAKMVAFGLTAGTLLFLAAWALIRRIRKSGNT